jgi:small membrane protein
MIVQILLSLGLAGCLLYVVSIGRTHRLFRFALGLTILIGMVFVWYPELTNRLAKLVGVGRGADLVMYVWIVLNLFFIARLHIKLREQAQAFTELARQMALKDAQSPDIDKK